MLIVVLIIPNRIRAQFRQKANALQKAAALQKARAEPVATQEVLVDDTQSPDTCPVVSTTQDQKPESPAVGTDPLLKATLQNEKFK